MGSSNWSKIDDFVPIPVMLGTARCPRFRRQLRIVGVADSPRCPRRTTAELAPGVQVTGTCETTAASRPVGHCVIGFFRRVTGFRVRRSVHPRVSTPTPVRRVLLLWSHAAARVILSFGMLYALHPWGDRRNPIIDSVFSSSSACCPNCRVTVPGNSVAGVPAKAWASLGRAATEPLPPGDSRRSLQSGHGSAGRRDMEMWGVLPRSGVNRPRSGSQARGLTRG